MSKTTLINGSFTLFTLVFWYMLMWLSPSRPCLRSSSPFYVRQPRWHRARRPGVLLPLAQGQRICVPGTTARTMISEVSDSVFVGWNHIVFQYVLSLCLSCFVLLEMYIYKCVSYTFTHYVYHTHLHTTIKKKYVYIYKLETGFHTHPKTHMEPQKIDTNKNESGAASDGNSRNWNDPSLSFI